MRLQSVLRALLVAAVALMTAACVKDNVPDNLKTSLYSSEHANSAAPAAKLEALTFSNNACPPAGTPQFIMPASRSLAARSAPRPGHSRNAPMRYSPGDRLNIAVYGTEEFSGDYVIGADGMLTLAFAGQVEAAGATNAELLTRVERAYVRAGLFTVQGVKLSVRPVQYAPINVTVAGAVFSPGRHVIGYIKDSDKHDKALSRTGDNPIERYIPAALRAAGGVRPDADLSNVRVIRDGKALKLDWRGAITGAQVDDTPLIDGDHVEVGESGCFQSALARPSQITPQGIRFIYSNLSAPVSGNQGTIQSHQFSGSVPYGTRLLQGLVQANCVGGGFSTNARRHAVLISRNPKTMETEVIQRSVEELVRSADRDTLNPYLMPDDAIACYDSAVTEVRDVLGILQAAVLPASTVRSAITGR